MVTASKLSSSAIRRATRAIRSRVKRGLRPVGSGRSQISVVSSSMLDIVSRTILLFVWRTNYWYAIRKEPHHEEAVTPRASPRRYAPDSRRASAQRGGARQPPGRSASSITAETLVKEESAHRSQPQGAEGARWLAARDRPLLRAEGQVACRPYLPSLWRDSRSPTPRRP